MIVTAMAVPRLFDRKLLLARRRRAEREGAETFLLQRTAEELVERLSAVKRRFALALDLGTPGAALAAALEKSGQVERVIACEPLAGLRDGRGLRVAADEEALPFADETLDLVVSALSLQWVNDLPGTFAQIRRALKPDGFFLAALIGGETLAELREALAAAESEIEGGASPRVSPFVEVRTLGALLQRADFALPVTDVERTIVRYASLRPLLRDLRRMGAANALAERSRKPLKRAVLARAEEIYARQFADPDGRLRATIDILWLSAWAPHESQQKPLRPGSAKMRLADALGTRERPAGEKAGRKPR
ncbi:MAG TPA: methyltransferase domain-containing protein [Xanthobacteraceae bacterium]|nr:methyltransferase domain-containing protein [Xanthobacteraceae bacterium]